MEIQIPKDWGRVLVYGTGWPPWKFRVLDKNKQPVENYTAEFVVKRLAKDKKALKTIKEGGGLSIEGAVRTFDTEVDVNVEQVVIGGWFKIGSGRKIPILYDQFTIITNTTPDA